MLKGKSLLDYTNLFFPNEYEKNDKIIFSLTKILRCKIYIALFVVSTENSKILKYTFSKKHLFFIIFLLKKKNQLRY